MQQLSAANAAANAAAAAAAAAALSASGQMLPQHRAMINAKNSGSPGGAGGNGASPSMHYGNGGSITPNGMVNGMGSPYGNGAGGALNGLTNGTGNGTPNGNSGGHTSPHNLMQNGHNFRLMPTSQEFCPQTMSNVHGWAAAQVFTTAVSSANGVMSQQTQQMMAAVQQQQHFANSPYGKFNMSAVQQQQQNGGGLTNGNLRMANMSATGNNATLVYRTNPAAVAAASSRISPPVRNGTGGGSNSTSPLKRTAMVYTPPGLGFVNGSNGNLIIGDFDVYQQPHANDYRRLSAFNLSAPPFTPASLYASNGSSDTVSIGAETAGPGGDSMMWSSASGKSIVNKA